MSFKENLLNKSNSYNYYKETTESLSLENKESKEIINQLKKDLENKDKNISLLKEEIKLLNDKNDHEIEFLDSVSNKINTILSDSFNRFNDYKRITAKNDKFYRQINN